MGEGISVYQSVGQSACNQFFPSGTIIRPRVGVVVVVVVVVVCLSPLFKKFHDGISSKRFEL